jgi:hypothetical protein
MTRELLQQALDALKVSAWDHIHAVGKQALIDAIIDRLAQPEPVALCDALRWSGAKESHGAMMFSPDQLRKFYEFASRTAPPAAPDIVNPITPAGMVTVPREPTQEMIAAGEAVFRSYCFRHVNGAIPTYEAMIAAVPAPAVPDDIAAIIACLGDDAALLRETTDDSEEIAQNMDDAAAALERLSAAPAVREPLTDEQIDALWRAPMSADWEHREFARAIEAHHGIGGGGK